MGWGKCSQLSQHVTDPRDTWHTPEYLPDSDPLLYKYSLCSPGMPGGPDHRGGVTFFINWTNNVTSYRIYPAILLGLIVTTTLFRLDFGDLEICLDLIGTQACQLSSINWSSFVYNNDFCDLMWSGSVLLIIYHLCGKKSDNKRPNRNLINYQWRRMVITLPTPSSGSGLRHSNR